MVCEKEVVLRCKNDVQFDALTVAEFHNALCGLARISLLVSRAGCYYRLVFNFIVGYTLLTI